jgi:hypothetical protein
MAADPTDGVRPPDRELRIRRLGVRIPAGAPLFHLVRALKSPVEESAGRFCFARRVTACHSLHRRAVRRQTEMGICIGNVCRYWRRCERAVVVPRVQTRKQAYERLSERAGVVEPDRCGCFHGSRCLPVTGPRAAVGACSLGRRHSACWTTSSQNRALHPSPVCVPLERISGL